MNLNSQTTPSQSTPPILSSSATDPESPSMVLGENGLVVEANSDDWSYDPNEPRYCICNQVSYGDMVACDNEAVSIQFHFYTFFVERKKLKKNRSLFSSSSSSFFLFKQCPFEWFHYPCVGITQPPKGKWYCPKCTASMKRRGIRKNIPT